MDVKQLIDNFKTVVTQHYVDFQGRTNRAVFWQYILVYFVIDILLAIPGMRLDDIFSVALFLPTLSISVRRLHDIGKSGWWVLLPAGPWLLTVALVFVALPLAILAGLVALICTGYVIYLYAQPGAAEPNQFGPATAAA